MLKRFKRINPNEYLYASARVRMLRNKIITTGKLHQMIDAPNLKQAFRMLNAAEIGLNETPENYEAALLREQAETYEIVRVLTKGLPLFDIFRFSFDGLNIKIALKSRAAGRDPLLLMTDLGTISKEEIIDGLANNNIIGLPSEMSLAALEAQDILSSTNDPQKADIVIDKSMLGAMYRIAHEYNNAFFQRVVRSKIDIENIRSLVRIKRAGKDEGFLKEVLCEGGYIQNDKWALIFKVSGMRNIDSFIEKTQYGPALRRAFHGLESGSRLTLFEKLCDNYMLTFIGEAYRTVFGVEPILGYLFEKENEITSVRMVMASKIANIPASTIIERLREYAW